jgi:Protein of unknown function (DUF3489)
MSKSKQSRLTDLQLLILSKASQREDHAIELPPNLKGGAAAKVVKKLIDSKLAKEVAAKPGMPAWRGDDASRRFALIITPAAFEVLGIEPDADGHASPAVRSGDAVGRKGRKETRPRTRSKAKASAQKRPDNEAPPRTGTKQALIITLLERQQGATIDDLVAATQWLPHTTRAALTGLRKKGFEIAKGKGESGKTVYRIRAEADPSKEPAARVSSQAAA